MSSACTTTIEARIASGTAFLSWKDTTSTTLNALSGITTATTDQQKTDLLTTEKDVTSTIACIQEKLTTLNTIPADIQTAQTAILALQQDIKDKEEELGIAKDRVGYIRDPDVHPSFYQGWFGMDRPMKPISIPIFIGIVLFFSIFILFGLLSIFGLSLTILVPSMRTGSSGTSMYLFQWIRSQITLPFWATLIALIAVVIYFRGRK